MQEWSTDSLPASAHFGFWREVICEAFATLDPRPAVARAAFPSRVSLAALGSAHAARIASCPQVVVRGPREIRLDPQDRLFVNLQVSGTGRVLQDQGVAIMQAGDFSVVDTARPYQLQFDGDFEVLSFRLPRDRLLGCVSNPAALRARTINGRTGVGRIAAGFMQSLIEGADVVPEPSCETLIDQLCEWIGEAARGSIGANASGTQRARELLVRSVHREIGRSLEDPDLSVPVLAARLGVSIRYLHKVCAAQGHSVAATIRETRLARCAQDLSNPLEHRPIAAIAARWGFGDIPHFTRMFRRRFGCSPGQWRVARAEAVVDAGETTVVVDTAVHSSSAQ